MKLNTVTIVGVGLIGGSIGLALRQRKLARSVVGVGWRQVSLSRAQRLGAIDRVALRLDEAVADSDLTIFCTPVTTIVEQVSQAAEHCTKNALFTDCGSTKGRIVERLEATLPPKVRYVGSHPLAGSEKRGVEHARPDLFEGRVCVVTATHRTSQSAIRKLREFWMSLGSRVVLLAPEVHDQIVAYTSHAPHLAAAALTIMLPERYREFAAGGFRDTTRIAASDPNLWTGIFLDNANRLLEALSAFEDSVSEFRTALERRDAAHLRELWHRAREGREAIDRVELAAAVAATTPVEFRRDEPESVATTTDAEDAKSPPHSRRVGSRRRS